MALMGFAVLAPGFSGPFILDDFSNIATNEDFQPEEWNRQTLRRAVFGNESGPLGRPVSMLSFVANAATTGLNPGPMKFTNAVLHGLTVVLLALILIRLFAVAPMGLDPHQQFIAALLASACWAVHPVAITSTLYVVQRMNLLATLFTFAALLAYLQARPWFFRSIPRTAFWAGIASFFFILGVLSKETALLAPLYVLLIEAAVYRFRDSSGEIRHGWRRFVLATAGVGLVAVLAILVADWSRWTGGYELRHYSLLERLLTELRVIWHYIGMILLPGHSRLGLFQDDIALSTGMFTPSTTFLSMVGLMLMLVLSALLMRRYAMISFGLLLFLSGHLLESTIFPLEIAFEHRNYLPAAGLMVVLASVFALVAKNIRAPLLAWLPLLIFSVFLAFMTVIRSTHWSDQYMLAQLEAFHHPRSARANTQLGFVNTQIARAAAARNDRAWTEFFIREAAHHFKTASDLNPHYRTPLFLWYLHSRGHGLPLFPREQYAELLQRLRHGLPGAETPGNLDMIFNCVMENCGASPEELEQLLHATLNNPLLRGRNRAETLVVAAKYFRYIRPDPEQVIFLLAQAVEAAPNHAKFRLYLARYLLEVGRSEDAVLEAQKAATVDKEELFSDEIQAVIQDSSG